MRQTRPAGNAGRLPVPGMANLRRMRVEDVMIPKAEIVSVPRDISKDALVEVFRDSGLTRLPVYKGTLDTPDRAGAPQGLRAAPTASTATAARFALRKMLRPLLFAPPSMPIGVLLQKMQTERIHMALVIDEYGGVDGLVTIEDLIEQVIGEIEDEHDIDEGAPLDRRKSPAATWRRPARRSTSSRPRSACRLVDDEDEEEIDTLGGLVFLLAGRVPARGEVIQHPDGVEFEVVDADPRRIKRLRVRLQRTSAADG